MFALSNVSQPQSFFPWLRFVTSTSLSPAIIYLDESDKVPLAIHNRHLCCSSHYHDRGASARVSAFSGFLETKPFLSPKSHHDIACLQLLPTRSKDKIAWECNNGGQLWTESAASGVSASGSFPSGFCAAGFSSLNVAFIASLMIDIVCQVCTPVIAPAFPGI
jgi:hypothetical protein